MDGYKRLMSSLFEDGLMNIGRMFVALMFTGYLVSKHPKRSKDYWIALYDVVMTTSDLIRKQQR